MTPCAATEQLKTQIDRQNFRRVGSDKQIRGRQLDMSRLQ